MTRNYHKFAGASLALILAFSPALSYAKNGNEDKGKRDDKKEVSARISTSDRSCLKAFGHLIAPGYIKNKGEVSFLADCFLPFGIKKKFGGSASSTPDTTAPNITRLSVQTGPNQAVITWRTDERANGQATWSTTSPVTVGSGNTASSTERGFERDRRVVIRGLSASTTYYFVARSTDKAGNATTSTQGSFTTKAGVVDTVSPVISEVAVLVGTTTLDVSWKTNENASSKVYFTSVGPLDINATTTTFVSSGILEKNHLVSLTGLTASTTYFLAAESSDQSGNKTVSASFTATTH